MKQLLQKSTSKQKNRTKNTHQPVEVGDKANDAHDSEPGIGGINNGIALIIGTTAGCRKNERAENAGPDRKGERRVVPQFRPTNPICDPPLRSKWGNFFHSEDQSEYQKQGNRGHRAILPYWKRICGKDLRV